MYCRNFSQSLLDSYSVTHIWQDNQFEGTIPPVNWTMLKQFAVSGNAFSGTLSESIGSFSQLQLFRIDGNRFTGTLPSSIGLWTKLQAFFIAGTSPPRNAFDFEVSVCNRLLMLIQYRNSRSGNRIVLKAHCQIP